MGTKTLRFANTAIVLREPLLVGLTVAFVIGLLVLSGWIDWSAPESVFGWLWLLFMLLVLFGLPAALLSWSQEIVVDPATRRVTQRHRLLHHVVAETHQPFTGFTAVVVQPKLDKETRAVTSPGSGGAKVATQTRYRTSYTLSLLRADTQVKLKDQNVSVPHHALDLPFDTEQDVLAMEDYACQLRSAGGWPARRRDYVMTMPDASPITTASPRLQAGAESEIEPR
jgi:hypothetical protein